MIAGYGLFGLFSIVALVVNIAIIMACLSLFHATLTLPGIAGIVLTMGVAVDANVLIYERIREEMKSGRGIDFVHRGRVRPRLRDDHRLALDGACAPRSSSTLSARARCADSPSRCPSVL